MLSPTCRQVRALAGAAIAIALAAYASPSALLARQRTVTDGTRLAGLRIGPHAVGFELKTTVDRTRQINRSDDGTTIGMAVWYPARAESAAGDALTSLDYRLMEFATAPTANERLAYERTEVDTLVGWRHVGIVELSEDDARRSLQTRGIARRGVPPRDGRHPVVMLFGGRYYLSSTAEFLASHGFLVVAPFRFADLRNDVGTDQFTWSVENAVRDAEWAVTAMRDDARADVGRVSAIGHGGGGMQAMLFAMRNTRVQALVNIDAGNFSSRSRARELPFYSPRLLRAPFLYLATSDTKTTQDQFEDFEAMTFSPRVEVVLENRDLRHHDLSDIGRAVTEPMHLRGVAYAQVQRAYADIHEMAVRFLLQHTASRRSGEDAFAKWIAGMQTPGTYAMRTLPQATPAPGIVEMLQTLDLETPGRLRTLHRSDPGAPVFQIANLARLTSKALAAGDFATATAIAEVGVELHPESPILREQKTVALEATGATAQALAEARTCASMSPGNDWQVGIAVRRCTEHVNRLAKTSAPRGDAR